MDWCAAVTVFPVWVWMIPAFVLISLQVKLGKKKLLFFSIGLWLAFLVVYDDHPAKLIHGICYDWEQTKIEEYQEQGIGLRVITFNALGDDSETLRHTKNLNPDIVCIQESPQPDELQDVGNEIFGGHANMVMHGDCSIITDGEISTKELNVRQHFFLPSRITLKTSLQVEVISLHLIPPVVCINLLSPSCWWDQTINRIRRREEIKLLRDHIDSVPDDIPIIAAGDYNAPAGDAVYRLLKPRLRDAYQIVGMGWGDTIHNQTPLVRIDQVWVCEQLQPTALVSQTSERSDHKMVICDLIMK